MIILLKIKELNSFFIFRKQNEKNDILIDYRNDIEEPLCA